MQRKQSRTDTAGFEEIQPSPGSVELTPAANDDRSESTSPPEIRSISAVSLATHDMARALQFYQSLGFNIRYGDEHATFCSLSAGSSYLNLIAQHLDRRWSWWGRVIFYVSDVDAFYQRAIDRGLRPQTSPRNATWDERYFHIIDPDGHELSFAKRLEH